MSWIIRQVTCQDLLGFNGRYIFQFDGGLNVVYGDNGQCKSSLVKCMKWGLAGKYPQIDAIHDGSYSMINKNAGLDNGNPKVVVELVNTETDDEMIVTRRGHKKARGTNEDFGLTSGQDGMDALEVAIAGNNHTGWYGDAQEVIEETLGLKTNTLVKCCIVDQDEIRGLISGKETETNSALHDLLDLRTLVDIGPLLTDGRKEAERQRKQLNDLLEGPDSPQARWDSRLDELHENFANLGMQACEGHGFESGEVSSDASIVESMTRRLQDSETQLNVDFSELQMADRVVSITAAVDELANRDPTNERGIEIATELERINRSIEDLSGASDSWGVIETDMSALLDDEGLGLISLAEEQQRIETLLTTKTDEMKALELSSELSSSVIKHLELHTDENECPICKSAADYQELKDAAEALMGPTIVARRTVLNSDIDSLESQLDAATNKYESAAQLHTRIITGVHDLEAVVGRLPQGTDFQLHPTDELLAGSGTVRELLEMIQSVNDVCDERQKAFEAEREQLVVQSTTWREEQLEPLRTVLTEVRALSDLLTGFTHITEHGARRDEVEIEQGVLRVQKGRATAVKGMLGSLAGSLTTSQLENAQQLINDATPDINEIFGRVCGNPQYDRIQIDARIQKANIVYSFKALPEQLVLGDVAAAVLSGGNQSVASIAAMMALAAGGTHNFNSLVLDDPCSDMDADTRARWCESASEFAPGRQFIVFTHQQDVAESLEGFGAHRDDLEGWEGGVLPGRRVD